MTHATTILNRFRTLLGSTCTPAPAGAEGSDRNRMDACVGAVPLSVCRPEKTYLLERAGIPQSGTALLFAVPYVMVKDIDDPERNLSLYAVPRDYHLYMEELRNTLLPLMAEAFPDRRFALFADHAPIKEVDAAARAGIGIIGRNGLLITPDYGNFVFIGELVTDADWSEVTGRPMSEAPKAEDEPPRCEDCGCCVRACPADFASNGMDACLSAITQKKKELTDAELSALARHPLVWGCDTCQLCCPHNRRVIREKRDTPIPFFRENRLIRLDSETLDAMSEEDFRERAYAWRGRAVIGRNVRLFEERQKSHPASGRKESP